METETSEISFVVKRREKENSWKEEGVKEEWLFFNVRKCNSI